MLGADAYAHRRAADIPEVDARAQACIATRAVRGARGDIHTVGQRRIGIGLSERPVETDAELHTRACRKVASREMKSFPFGKHETAVSVVVPIQPAFQGRPFRRRALSSPRLSCRVQDQGTSRLLTALLVFCGCIDRARKRSRGQTE